MALDENGRYLDIFLDPGISPYVQAHNNILGSTDQIILLRSNYFLLGYKQFRYS